MDRTKKDRVAAAGWRSGDAADFLELTEEEAAFVELRLALADYLRELRVRNSWTQSQVARQLGSSQSRVAKMEAADASVSLDLLIKSLLTLGASRSEVGRVIAKEDRRRAPGDAGGGLTRADADANGPVTGQTQRET